MTAPVSVAPALPVSRSFDLHQARIALDAAQREFVRRACPWARQREPRQKAADATEEPPLHP